MQYYGNLKSFFFFSSRGSKKRLRSNREELPGSSSHSGTGIQESKGQPDILWRGTVPMYYGTSVHCRYDSALWTGIPIDLHKSCGDHCHWLLLLDGCCHGKLGTQWYPGNQEGHQLPT